MNLITSHHSYSYHSSQDHGPPLLGQMVFKMASQFFTLVSQLFPWASRVIRKNTSMIILLLWFFLPSVFSSHLKLNLKCYSGLTHCYLCSFIHCLLATLDCAFIWICKKKKNCTTCQCQTIILNLLLYCPWMVFSQIPVKLALHWGLSSEKLFLTDYLKVPFLSPTNFTFTMTLETTWNIK